MKALIIDESSVKNLIDRLELKKFQQGKQSTAARLLDVSDANAQHIFEEAIRAYNYVLLEWLKEQGM